MANRILRDWTDSEKIDLLSPQAEVFLVRLFMKADDFGCYHGNPKLLRASLFPLRLDSIREADLQRWIAECVKAGLIVLYESADRPFVQVVNFGQRLRSMKHKFPPNDSDPPSTVSNSRTNDSDPPPEEEEKGKPNPNQKPNPKREVTLAEFEMAFDELWWDTIQSMSVHKGKDIKGAIQKAYLHMKTEGRLERGGPSDFKKCVQSFLNNERSAPNSKPKVSIKDFLANA
jgi:hypothetical protein